MYGNNGGTFQHLFVCPCKHFVIKLFKKIKQYKSLFLDGVLDRELNQRSNEVLLKLYHQNLASK